MAPPVQGTGRESGGGGGQYALQGTLLHGTDVRLPLSVCACEGRWCPGRFVNLPTHHHHTESELSNESKSADSERGGAEVAEGIGGGGTMRWGVQVEVPDGSGWVANEQEYRGGSSSPSSSQASGRASPVSILFSVASGSGESSDLQVPFTCTSPMFPAEGSRDGWRVCALTASVTPPSARLPMSASPDGMRITHPSSAAASPRPRTEGAHGMWGSASEGGHSTGQKKLHSSTLAPCPSEGAGSSAAASRDGRRRAEHARAVAYQTLKIAREGDSSATRQGELARVGSVYVLTIY